MSKKNLSNASFGQSGFHSFGSESTKMHYNINNDLLALEESHGSKKIIYYGDLVLFCNPIVDRLPMLNLYNQINCQNRSVLFASNSHSLSSSCEFGVCGTLGLQHLCFKVSPS